eukprot:3730408-Pyramimonas_sp.AAC.1
MEARASPRLVKVTPDSDSQARSCSHTVRGARHGDVFLVVISGPSAWAPWAKAGGVVRHHVHNKSRNTEASTTLAPTHVRNEATEV